MYKLNKIYYYITIFYININIFNIINNMLNFINIDFTLNYEVLTLRFQS